MTVGLGEWNSCDYLLRPVMVFRVMALILTSPS